jgi:mono/diheme cytochrome c family protein
MTVKFSVLRVKCLTVMLAVVAGAAQGAEVAFFEKEVRPLLIQQCYECHSAKKQKGGLRVDGIDYLKEGGSTGPAVVPGDLEKSLLIEAVRYHNDELQMPPKEKLSEKQIAVLETWVKSGAAWPATDLAAREKVDAFGFTEADRKFWSFQPLTQPQPPAVKSAWARTSIDRFIAAKHRELGLSPAAEASREELVRRLYFTLHGLPPTPEQRDAFVKNTDPQAYERLLDELLASPRYGERWAQHWLDLVRYAESDGYNQDAIRPAAYHYRDYVVKSLNADKPYDQFMREQLAGDEINADDPEVLVATSYLRNPIYEYNQRDAHGQYDVVLTDMTDNAGEVFMGLSMGCARCHDHKFDPILQADYYRLRAFFTPVRWKDDEKLATPAQKAEWVAANAKWEEATKPFRAKIDAILEPRIQKAMREAYEKFQPDIRAMVDKKPAERQPEDWQASYFCERQMDYERERFDVAKTLSKKPEEKAAYDAAMAELKAFDHLKPQPLPSAFIATDAMNRGPKNLLKTRREEKDIPPGFLTLLEPEPPQIAAKEKTTGRRSALAAWLAKPTNPLSTRVIANRVWHYLFGRGIVASPNDFGQLGERPTHPELLDYLTQRFLAGGWRMKSLHKEILLSATFRQTAHVKVSDAANRIDPSNKYLWRYQPRRLDAEQVRDAMLAASGELDLKQSGASEDGNGLRRSIYTLKRRNSQNELLRSLDAPAGFASTSERQSTTTPTQALLLVNGDWAQARARKLSERIYSVEEAWQYALGRQPSQAELAQAQAFIAKRSSEAPVPTAKANPADAAEFKPGTEQESLIAAKAEKTGDEFSIQAIVKLNSVDDAAAVRTIASHWNGGKENVDGYGWSLGVTGMKSRFKAYNLVLQLVGEDENGNTAYEPIPSDIRLELGSQYHITVRVSCAQHQLEFTVQQLDKSDSPLQRSVVQHRVREGLDRGAADLVIGAVHRRGAPHPWEGSITALRIAQGLQPEEQLLAKPEAWLPEGVITWNAKAGLTDKFAWNSAKGNTEPQDAKKLALADLCHVLLNANEFFYLH